MTITLDQLNEEHKELTALQDKYEKQIKSKSAKINRLERSFECVRPRSRKVHYKHYDSVDKKIKVSEEHVYDTDKAFQKEMSLLQVQLRNAITLRNRASCRKISVTSLIRSEIDARNSVGLIPGKAT